MKKGLTILNKALLLVITLCFSAAAQSPSSITPGGEEAGGLSSTGTIISKIVLLAVAIFIAILAGYLALKKKEVKAEK